MKLLGVCGGGGGGGGGERTKKLLWQIAATWGLVI